MNKGWLGPLDGLVPAHSTPAMSITPEVDRTYQTTMGGRRFVRSAPRGHREWSVSATGGRGGETANVQMFASGAWGAGPWWWLSPWAVGVNALTPDGSVLAHMGLAPSAAVGGPVVASDGTAFPVSAALSGTTFGVGMSASSASVPCVGGVRVTASVYVSAGQRVQVAFQGAGGGATFGNALSPVSDGPLRRMSVSTTAPANATRVRIDVIGAGLIAGAALSFTDSLRAWAVGDGCEFAVVDSESRNVRVVSANPWSDQSFTIREVG